MVLATATVTARRAYGFFSRHAKFMNAAGLPGSASVTWWARTLGTRWCAPVTPNDIRAALAAINGVKVDAAGRTNIRAKSTCIDAGIGPGDVDGLRKPAPKAVQGSALHTQGLQQLGPAVGKQ